jgi:agmatinase
VPLVELAARRHGAISVLQIDAHADLRDQYRGSPFSHGCVMRRVLETTGSICQVGIRSFSAEEVRQCPRQVENFFSPARIAREGDWIENVLASLREKVYITVDIDGFDPAYAPGTGTPEPGGLDWFQVTGLLRRVCLERQVVAADIVEVRPIGLNHITEYLAARLAYKIVAYTQQTRA